MKKRKKYCKYCGEIFYPKRIDAKYCSNSCRNMGYRAQYNTELYSDSVQVMFKLRSEEFLFLINEGEKLGITAEEHAKTICKLYIKQNKN